MSGFISILLVMASLAGNHSYSKTVSNRFTPPRLPLFSQERQLRGDMNEAIGVPSSIAPSSLPVRASGTTRPSIGAMSALLIHEPSGAILYAKDAGTPRPIASLTKLMTALVSVDLVQDWDSVILITAADDAKSGRLYIRPRDRYTIRDLLHMSLIASANDATLALARATGLTREEFIRAMNAKARALGLTYATFADPTGLDPRNVASASEVAQMLTAASSHPMLHDILHQKEYRYQSAIDGNGGVAYSTNKLLQTSAYDIIAGKTGYIDESGYNFAALANNQQGTALLAVVLGAPSEQARFSEVDALFSWAREAWHFDNP